MRQLKLPLLGLFGFFGLLGFLVPASAFAAPITFRYQHYLFAIDPASHPEWQSGTVQWEWNGQTMEPPEEYRVDGDQMPALPAGVTTVMTKDWSPSAIRATLETEIARKLDRDPGSVKIRQTGTGAVAFDGVGLTGRKVDLDTSTELALTAIHEGIDNVTLPVIITQPQMTVDPALQAMGIKEVVTIGESDMSNSPPNRQHNIGVGLSRFNGHLIPAGSVFSFDAVLGRVDGSTGYLKELVIKGDRTEPDYRGVWEYGFPILARRNHSYIVGHYAPVGSDATVYPGSADMVFKNDSPTALLMQTHRDGNNVYFIYYGTRDDRKSEVIGPYVLSHTPPPPDRTEYTTALPPGTKKKLNERIPGAKVLWFRVLQTATGSQKVERIFSDYQARPLFYQVGVASLPGGSGSTVTLPGSLPLDFAE